jgi:hypothetical protein
MWRDERGIAMVLVLLCAVLFVALGGALVTVVNTEATISATFREAAIALSAADAVVTRVVVDLAAADLTAALTGGLSSTFADGPPAVPRRLPDGTILDLPAATNEQRCGEPDCSDAAMDAVTADRPWGVNNARWQLYGSGWVRDLTPHPDDAPHAYVVVWIGDDPLETDGNPLADEGHADAPGHEVVLLRAAAYAAYSVRRRIEVAARRDAGVVRIISWREIR